jgi:hypothetical protein
MRNGRDQMIETFYQLGAYESLCDGGGGLRAVQLFKKHTKRVRRADNRSILENSPEKAMAGSLALAAAVGAQTCPTPPSFIRSAPVM